MAAFGLEWVELTAGAGPFGLRAMGGGVGLGGAWTCSARGSGSRDSGRIVSVTMAQRACSSGDRPRTGSLDSGDAALGQEDERAAVRRHAARNALGLVASAPEGVEAIGALDCATGILCNP